MSESRKRKRDDRSPSPDVQRSADYNPTMFDQSNAYHSAKNVIKDEKAMGALMDGVQSVGLDGSVTKKAKTYRRNLFGGSSQSSAQEEKQVVVAAASQPRRPAPLQFLDSTLNRFFDDAFDPTSPPVFSFDALSVGAEPDEEVEAGAISGAHSRQSSGHNHSYSVFAEFARAQVGQPAAAPTTGQQPIGPPPAAPKKGKGFNRSKLGE